MNTPFAGCLAALLCLASALASTAADAPKLPAEFSVQAVDAFLAAQVKQPGRVGLSVAIVKDG